MPPVVSRWRRIPLLRQLWKLVLLFGNAILLLRGASLPELPQKWSSAAEVDAPLDTGKWAVIHGNRHSAGPFHPTVRSFSPKKTLQMLQLRKFMCGGGNFGHSTAAPGTHDEGGSDPILFFSIGLCLFRTNNR